MIAKMRLSKLRRYHFVDVNDLDVGSLEDVTLDSESLIPQHLILGSNFFEELLEEMGKRANIDEIAPINLIKGIEGNFVVIGVPVDKLETTTDDGHLPHGYNVYKYSELLNMEVEDVKGKVDLDLIDLEIQGEDSHLIFNYDTIHHELITQGYMQRFEISYHVKHVKIKDGIISVPSTKTEVIDKVKNSIEPKMKGKTTIQW